MSEKTYKGSCFCGAVQLSVTGDPVMMGYCHCNSCRSWAASPVNAFTLWKPDSVTVTQGQDKLEMFQKTPESHRQFCRICGGNVMTFHPSHDIVDVYAAVIPDLPFRPELHGSYGIYDVLGYVRSLARTEHGLAGRAPDGRAHRCR